MAKRRSLWRSISTSTKVTVDLPEVLGWRLAEFGQLLFSWLVPHCDDWGRFDGDAFNVRAKVMPISRRPLEAFEKVLQALHKVGLVRLYEVSGKRYLYFPDWETRQSGLHKRRPSTIPDPPPGSSGKFREQSGAFPENLHEDEVEDEVERLFNPPYPPAGGGESRIQFDWTARKATIIVKQAPKLWQKSLLKNVPKLILFEPVRVLAILLDVMHSKKRPEKPWTAMAWILTRLKKPKFQRDANYDKAKKLLRRA